MINIANKITTQLRRFARVYYQALLIQNTEIYDNKYNRKHDSVFKKKITKQIYKEARVGTW